MVKNAHVQMHDQTFAGRRIHGLFHLVGLHRHAMNARQRINKMETRRERFRAHVAEKIENSDVSGGNNASRAKQQ